MNNIINKISFIGFYIGVCLADMENLIIPILSLITFTIFERTNKLEFKYTIYGVVPTLIYGIYYFVSFVDGASR